MDQYLAPLQQRAEALPFPLGVSAQGADGFLENSDLRLGLLVSKAIDVPANAVDEVRDVGARHVGVEHQAVGRGGSTVDLRDSEAQPLDLLGEAEDLGAQDLFGWPVVVVARTWARESAVCDDVFFAASESVFVHAGHHTIMGA